MSASGALRAMVRLPTPRKVPVSKIFLGFKCADDGCEKGIGDNKAEAGEADGVDGRQDDLGRFFAAEECGEVAGAR